MRMHGVLMPHDFDTKSHEVFGLRDVVRTKGFAHMMLRSSPLFIIVSIFSTVSALEASE